jgi:apolipoprotein N-acyltransferase
MLHLEVFVLIWLLVEFARGHLFTGFPWNLAGYAFAATDVTIQMASLVGAYGLTAFAVLLGALPAAILLRYPQAKGATCIVYAIFIGGCFWGAWRLHQADAIAESDRYIPGVTMRLVQANILQHHKWDPKLQFDGLQKHITLTQSEGLDKVQYVVWPETSIPYKVKPNTPLTQIIGSALPEQTMLIAGTLRSETHGNDWSIYNSLMVFDHNGAILNNYDKHHLVPFGEFLPLRWLLPPSWLTPVGMKDFTAGEGPKTLYLDRLSVSPLICYEAIFPGNVMDDLYPPQLLLNITNDAWFGMSTGPYQHFHMARMRAAEEGIPLIRVANTGISAVVDAYGRVEASLPLGTEGILDVKIPKANWLLKPSSPNY